MPRVWPNVTAPDLLVAGPNVGQNLGSFLYTLSGTMGATYAAVGRGVPAIAVSASSVGGQRSYQWINETTASGYADPATVHAELTVKLVEQLVKGTKKGERLLPLGYGLKYVGLFLFVFCSLSLSLFSLLQALTAILTASISRPSPPSPTIRASTRPSSSRG